MAGMFCALLLATAASEGAAITSGAQQAIPAKRVTAALGGTSSTYSFDNIDQVVPDGSTVGLSDRRTIIADFTAVTSVTVSLNIAGGINGDLYVQLTHRSGFTVLLNRVGRTASNPFGYADAGMNIQFQAGAPAVGDIHEYRLTLSGSESTPLGGPLTGIWMPDGRAVDPGLSLDTDPRTALLSSFNGLDPNGEWTLFVADVDGGGVSTLRSWGLEVQGVPEPGTSSLILASLCLCFVSARSRRRPSRLL